MDDAFETLGMPRAAAIDLPLLEKRFHELSKETHPDVNRGDGGKFEAVNAAFGVLRKDSKRLRHLREWEFPDAEVERAAPMDPGLMDLFAKLGPAMQRADAVAKELARAKSALAKALLADAIWEAREAVEETGAEVAERLRELAGEFAEIDGRLAGGDRDGALTLLDRSYQAAAFLEKWQAQVREKLMGMMVV